MGIKIVNSFEKKNSFQNQIMIRKKRNILLIKID